MRSKLIDKILKETPIETRVKVSIQSHFIVEHGGTMLMPLDENGEDIPEAAEANEKCYKLAEPLIKAVLKDIEEWKNEKAKEVCPECGEPYITYHPEEYYGCNSCDHNWTN